MDSERSSRLMYIGATTCFIGLAVSPVHYIIDSVIREGWLLPDILNILGILCSFVLYNFVEHKKVGSPLVLNIVIITPIACYLMLFARHIFEVLFRSKLVLLSCCS